MSTTDISYSAISTVCALISDRTEVVMTAIKKALIFISAIILAAVVLIGRLFPGEYVTPPEWI